MALRVVVVGRDGRAYDEGGWATSATFWSGGQKNLLIADNQTTKYDSASEAGRRLLEKQAWFPPRVGSVDD